ncbi:phosphorylase family protein [Hydrogenophaga sp. BPS33]|uniref:phosphorylase family protein n=1 Tax=Hydrogenophaga sp. BPS33 TaxID=2651974 RepID=UPI0013200B5A|nr:hypothetical protein [Hydrogenophaga sp. BPS33]QHE87230.1 hypothetical protein F9K07_21180 [Hydrogenophaga sp. BPS33]
MKILIADDQTRRYERLIAQLLNEGFSRSNIHLVASANDARDKMESITFDLLVLDFMLPLWPDQEPNVQHSIDLLFELQNGDALKRPRKILGITGDISLMPDAKANFERMTWNVLEFSERDDAWSNSILASAKYLGVTGQRTAVEGADVVVVCALRSPELDQILKLPWKWGPSEPIDDHTFVHRGTFSSGTRTYSVAAAFAPRMGMVATALLSARLIAALRPKLVAMCGICAGVRDKTNFGDVLIADPAWDFQSGKQQQQGDSASLAFAPHQIPCTPLVRSHLEQLRDDNAALYEIHTHFEGTSPGNVPRIVVGPVASGSAVIANGNIVEEIKKQHRNLVGVEMEGYGLYAAAQDAATPQPSFVSLKSVCDFGDAHKGDDYQRYAAYTSARVFQLLMERFGTRLLSSEQPQSKRGR